MNEIGVLVGRGEIARYLGRHGGREGQTDQMAGWTDRTDRPHGQTARTDRTDRPHGQTARTDRTDRPHGQTARTDRVDRPDGQTGWAGGEIEIGEREVG